MLAVIVPVRGQATVLKDNLYGVKALSASEAWAVGNFGSIYHTGDGGRTWEARDSGTKLPLFAVDFADANNGWAVGKSALIVRTADGGRTWKRQKSAIPPEKHLFDVQAVDARTVWAVGDWGAIAVTHDGGDSWENRSLGTIPVQTTTSPERVTHTLTDDVILYDVSFPDAEHGFIGGEFGTVLATRDGGGTWEKQETGTDKTLFGLSFSTRERGWAVGIDGLILHTRDGGQHWEVQRGAAQQEALEDLGFLEKLRNPGLYAVDVSGAYGVVVGDTGILLTTADGGETWEQHELPEKQRLVWMRGVSVVPDTQGFVVGASGFAARLDRDRVQLTGAPSPP
jgi:photosystem II stability/assembly factor-like uncharacterized protein